MFPVNIHLSGVVYASYKSAERHSDEVLSIGPLYSGNTVVQFLAAPRRRVARALCVSAGMSRRRAARHNAPCARLRQRISTDLAASCFTTASDVFLYSATIAAVLMEQGHDKGYPTTIAVMMPRFSVDELSGFSSSSDDGQSGVGWQMLDGTEDAGPARRSVAHSVGPALAVVMAVFDGKCTWQSRASWP